jgi:uncharacterized OsmC-like protein
LSVNVPYKTAARPRGARDGRSATLDGTFEVTTPKELGGTGGDGANPDKLFAAGYAACFLGATKFVASQGGPKVRSDATVTATVGRRMDVTKSTPTTRCGHPRLRMCRRTHLNRMGRCATPQDPRPCRCSTDPNGLKLTEADRG